MGLRVKPNIALLKVVSDLVQIVPRFWSFDTHVIGTI